jgi:hypothetical protein
MRLKSKLSFRSVVAAVTLCTIMSFGQVTDLRPSRSASIRRNDGLKKQVLQPHHNKCGRMRLLEERTGLSVQEIRQMYDRSRAINFGHFTCAVLVSKQLNVNTEVLLQELNESSILRALERMGIEQDRARMTISATIHEMVDSEAKNVI